jgi:hypothetical protein
MKTAKLFFLGSALLIANLTLVNASGNESQDKAYKQLNEQIKAVFKQIPEDQLTVSDKSHFLLLTFSVNEKHELENIQVESTDEKLSDYAKKVLVSEKIKVNPLFDGKKGQISIQLPNEG